MARFQGGSVPGSPPSRKATQPPATPDSSGTPEDYCADVPQEVLLEYYKKASEVVSEPVALIVDKKIGTREPIYVFNTSDPVLFGVPHYPSMPAQKDIFNIPTSYTKSISRHALTFQTNENGLSVVSHNRYELTLTYKDEQRAHQSKVLKKGVWETIQPGSAIRLNQFTTMEFDNVPIATRKRKRQAANEDDQDSAETNPRKR